MSRKTLFVAFFIGSCLLCAAPVNAMETTSFLAAFPLAGSAGYTVSIFYTWRLYKRLQKGECFSKTNRRVVSALLGFSF